MLKSKVMHERREFGRRRATVAAKIRLAGQTVLDCIVLNVSEGGALLDLNAEVNLPPRFMLCIGDGVPLACVTRHRNGARLGVEFVVARAVVAVDPKAVGDLVAYARQVRWGQAAE